MHLVKKTINVYVSRPFLNCNASNYFIFFAKGKNSNSYLNLKGKESQEYILYIQIKWFKLSYMVMQGPA